MAPAATVVQQDRHIRCAAARIVEKSGRPHTSEDNNKKKDNPEHKGWVIWAILVVLIHELRPLKRRLNKIRRRFEKQVCSRRQEYLREQTLRLHLEQAPCPSAAHIGEVELARRGRNDFERPEGAGAGDVGIYIRAGGQIVSGEHHLLIA